MRRHLAFAAVFAAAFQIVSPASAALVARLGGYYYDTVLDITWAPDTNAAKTFAKILGLPDSGLVNNQAAQVVASYFSYLNPVTGIEHRNWRLPTLGPDVGNFNPFDEGFDGQRPNGQGALGAGWGTPADSGIYSELGWMFYANLGGHPRCLEFVDGTCHVDPDNGLPRDDAGERDTGPFDDLKLAHYWTDVLARDPDSGLPYAYWSFTFSDGNQSPRPPSQPQAYVWLVHDGDIAAAPVTVPEPATWALLLAGLGAIGAARGLTNRPDPSGPCGAAAASGRRRGSSRRRAR